jgi:arylsulfatase A-like enzyme
MTAPSPHREPRLATVATIIVLTTVVLAAGCSKGGDAGASKPKAASRPNVVFVMTDDMRYDDMDLVADLKPDGGFDWMRSHSTKFPKLWVSDNLCCPSRTTALTGETSYNSKVFDNSKYVDLENTLPMWLQRQGYCTGFTGKYLNGYTGGKPRPRGWTYWQPLVHFLDNETGYTMIDRKGHQVKPGTFITDRLTADSRAQLTDCLDAGKPSFVAYWPFAPHFGSNPAPQYQSVPVPWQPTDPSFNEADISDKPEWLQKLYPTQRANAVQRYQAWTALRVRTLLSVDDGLKSLIDTLQARHVLDKTIIILTSDNGWYEGEHRIDLRKEFAYEAGQVALWIAGPGFTPKTVDDAYVTNVDVVPTIVRATGARPKLPMDGLAIQTLLHDSDHGRDRFLPLYVPRENGDTSGVPTGTGVRTWRYKYVKYSDGSEELYDLQKDPFELTNIAADASAGATKRAMQDLMHRAELCRGASCREPAPRALQ